jgi:hypothetical protein
MSERSANGSLYAGHQYLYLPDEEATACGGEAIDACYVGDVVISAITFAELEYGALISANPLMQRRNLASMIQSIPVASFDAGAAIAYGAIRQATRERKRDQLDVTWTTAHIRGQVCP